MDNNFDEKRVQEILNVYKNSYGNSNATQKELSANNSFDEKRVEEAMNVLRGTSNKEQEEVKEFSWPRFIGERFTKGFLNLADMPQAITESTGNPNLNLPEREWTREDIENFSKNRSTPIVSGSLKSLVNKAGIDLESQGEGSTTAQKIIGKGAEFAGSSLIPGGGLSGIARNVALGGAIGTETGALEELGVPEPVAGLASLATVLAGAPALGKAIKNAISRTPNLSDAEKKVANYLQQVLGEEGLTSVKKNIAEQPNYSMTGYEPTTAEVSNNPFFSTLHRLRQGIPGTGLQKIAGEQNEALHRVSDKLSSEAITTPELKEVIKNEAISRKATRHQETEPLYEKLRQDKTQVEPLNINKFLEENKIVKGKKRKDLESIRKLISPSEKLTAEEELALKSYEKQKKYIEDSKMSESAKEREVSRLERPKSNNPTVADLDEARQNINDMIKDLKKSGQDNRVQQLKKAKDALDKDLANFPLQKEVTAKYAELSKPVNEILQHPSLKNIPENRLNEIFDSLYNNKSLDNVKALKQVLKDKPQEWKGVQDATVEHLMKSIKNAGAEGNRNILSYHKLDKFLKKHEKSLEEVFTSDQMKFLEELKSALKGRNIAETSGIEKQSATYGKLITGTQLTEGFGTKLLKGASYVPHAIPKVGKYGGEALRSMLNGYLKSRESNVMEALDNFLKNPEYASKLINHKFKSQAEFNKEMGNISRGIFSLVVNAKDKQSED